MSSLLSVLTEREREREHNSWNNSLRQQKKKSTEIANNLPRANSILFLPAKRPFDGSLNPFFPFPSSSPARPLFSADAGFILLIDFFSRSSFYKRRSRKKLHFNFTDGTHTQPSSSFCSTLLHIPLLHACVCSKEASPVFVRARAKLAYCDVCLSVYIKVIKASDLKEAEKRDSPTLR